MLAIPGLPYSKPVRISYVTWRREEGTYYELFTQWTVYILLLTSISQSCILSSISIPSHGLCGVHYCTVHCLLAVNIPYYQQLTYVLYINHSMFSTRTGNHFEILFLNKFQQEPIQVEVIIWELHNFPICFLCGVLCWWWWVSQYLSVYWPQWDQLLN